MRVVAVSGMIGTGKTTLCRGLSELSGWPVVQEAISNNKFLGLFYDDMDRWALASQLSFMLDKTQLLQTCFDTSTEVLLIDRTIQEDFHVFASVLRRYEILSDAEYRLLERFYKLLSSSWPVVDLNIYLEDTDENCFQRLLNRGDALESKVEIGYIKTVGDEYRRWRKASLKAPYYELRSANMDFRESSSIEHVLTNIRLLLKLDK